MKCIKAVIIICLLLIGVNANELDSARAEYKNYTKKEIAKSIAESLAASIPIKTDAISTIIGSTSIGSTVMITSIISRKGLAEIVQNDFQKMTKTEKDTFTSNMIEEMRKMHLNTLCTTPETKAALEKGVDFSYQYKWDDFAYFGKVEINNKSCKNIKL